MRTVMASEDVPEGVAVKLEAILTMEGRAEATIHGERFVHPILQSQTDGFSEHQPCTEAVFQIVGGSPAHDVCRVLRLRGSEGGGERQTKCNE